MIVLFLLFGGLYMVFLIITIVSWHAIQPLKMIDEKERGLSVSVIIPVRNEERNIGKLLAEIESQIYPKENLEILVVNDHSTDRSVNAINGSIQGSTSTIKLINLSDGKAGKKSALSAGINQANGEIIITIDGDCSVGKNWVGSMASTFEDEVQMAFGPVAISTQSFFDKLQMIDFSALIGVGAATWQLGMSGMCNGANLAFRKNAFEACHGYAGSEQHPSGDDEFLMRKMHEAYPKGIRFVKSTEAVVFTEPQPSLRDFINQRIRWAGKWKLHKDWNTKMMALFMFVFYALLIGVSIYSSLEQENLLLVGSIWGLKWVLDVLLVKSVLKLSDQKVCIAASLLLSLVYPFYTFGIGISTINYTFEWKGRKY
jgi:cellulose synthase/poly-beta-1,6-N-acetylglucosamine synthase-like glycosyltransferase